MRLYLFACLSFTSLMAYQAMAAETDDASKEASMDFYMSIKCSDRFGDQLLKTVRIKTVSSSSTGKTGSKLVCDYKGAAEGADTQQSSISTRLDKFGECHLRSVAPTESKCTVSLTKPLNECWVDCKRTVPLTEGGKGVVRMEIKKTRVTG